MPLFGLLATAVPTGSVYAGLDGEKAPEPLGYEVAVNALPDAMQVLLIVLAIVAVIAVVAFVVCLIINPPQSRYNRSLRRRMEQDSAFLQSSYFNTASNIMNEAMRHRR